MRKCYENCRNNDSTWSHRSHKSLWSTFTFTHTYIGRFSSDRLIREYTDPDLSLTLHISCHCNTSSFNLTACNPLSLQSLYAKRTKGQLVTSLGITFLTTFLLSSEFCLLGIKVWICRGEVFGKRELAPNFTQSKESGRGNNGGNNGGKNFKRKKNNR